MEKCIVRASNRRGLGALSVCVGGGGGGADLEVDPTQEINSANRYMWSKKVMGLMVSKAQSIHALPELRALTFSLDDEDEDLTSDLLG